MPTFKACGLGNMESSMLPANGILGVTAMRLQHLMERSDAVTGLELGDIVADSSDNTGNIIALVESSVHPFGELPEAILEIPPRHDCWAWDVPILRICSAHNNFNQNLIRSGCRNGAVDDLDGRSLANQCFFHGGDEMRELSVVLVGRRAGTDVLYVLADYKSHIVPQ